MSINSKKRETGLIYQVLSFRDWDPENLLYYWLNSCVFVYATSMIMANVFKAESREIALKKLKSDQK